MLELGFQEAEYLMAEANDQMVCLEVISGMLDAGITVDVTISTQQLFAPQNSATKGQGVIQLHAHISQQNTS